MSTEKLSETAMSTGDETLEDLMADEDLYADLPEFVRNADPETVKKHARLLENEMKSMKGELNRLKYSHLKEAEEIKANKEKVGELVEWV
jgi:alanyl-tRNA synthetase